MAHRILTSLVGIDATFSSTLSLTSLAGVGNRMLIVNSAGTVSTQAIPTGTVTSVGLSMPSAFTVTNSPVTGAGTLTVTGSGTTAQYIDGTGALQTLPTSTSTVQHQVKAGVAINKGQPVYVTGSTGGAGTNMIVGLASNAAEATSSKTMGLLDATVAINGFANVITEGLLSGLDTSAANAAGDPVWLGVNGALIYGLANKPYAPAHLVFIGIVTRVSATVGEIFIRPQNGFELEELHNVQITSTPADNTVLSYENSSSLYKMKSIATLLGYTPVSGTGTTNYLSKFTGSTALGNSLLYDDGTNVGIGTSSPGYKLDVNGTGRYQNDLTVLGNIYHNSDILNTTGNTGGITISGGSAYNSGANIRLYPSINGTTPNQTQFFAGSTQTGVIFSNGNWGINTTTDAGYKLDVNGTTRFQGDSLITKSSGALTASVTSQTTDNSFLTVLNGTSGLQFTSRGSGATGNMGLPANSAEILSYSKAALGIILHTTPYLAIGSQTTEMMRLVASTGNFLINTTTDAGYKLDINGTTRSQGKLTITTGGAEITGIVVAYSGVQSYGAVQIFSGLYAQMFNTANNSKASFQYINANGLLLTTNSDNISGVLKGLQVNPTMVAAANNDVLVGLDITPTYTNGAFTGVSNIGLRVSDSILIGSTLLSTNTTAFPLQVNLTNAASNVGAIWRNGSSTGYTSFRFYNDQNSGSRALEMGYSGSAYSGAIISGGISGESAYITSTGAYPLQLGTNNTTKAIITSGGNVLIGTSTDAGYKLDVNGTGIFRNVLTGYVNSGSLVLGAASSNSLAVTITGYFTGNGSISSTNYNARGFNINIGGQGYGFFSSYNGNAQGNVESNYYFRAANPINITAGTIGLYGYDFSPSITSETNATIYAFSSTLNAASNHYNLYLSGTAKNYIAGVVGIETTTLGTEANLYLGAKGTTEGGQLILQKGTAQTYAAHLDNYTDQFRIMHGTDTASTGVRLAVALSTGQLILPAYTSTSSFTGTAVGYIAFDASGNLLTVAAPGGAVSSVSGGTGVTASPTTGNVVVSIGQSVATSATPSFDQVFATNNGNGTNFKVGDDSWIGDINVVNTFRVMGQQDATKGYIVFGNSDTTALGRSGTGALTYGGYTIYHSNNSNTITALGTITTGVWNGTAIGDTYISSASTWNAKQNAITLTTTGTSGAATFVGSTLNIPQYQAVLTNPVTGTGTTNYITKWTSSSAVGSSVMYDDGTNVGIGTASPSYKLDVVGNSRISSGGNTRLYIDTTNATPNTGFALSVSNVAKWSVAAYKPSGTNISYVLYNEQTGTNSLFIQGDTNNVIIGSTTDAGYKLDVLGTTRFGGNSLVSLNQNAETSLTVSNTTSGGSSSAQIKATSSGGSVQVGKWSGASSTYKTIVANDSFLYSAGVGNISILNDYASGNINFASGGVSTAQMTLFTTGNLGINTTTDSGYKLDVLGTTRIQNTLTVSNPSYTGGGSFYQSANFTTVISGGPASENITFGPSNRIFLNASQVRVQTGSLQVASTLSVGTTTATSLNMIWANGSITAGSNIARGIFTDTTLIASANNDVLIGLDVTPTFTNGAYTNVTNWAAKISGPLAGVTQYMSTGAAGNTHYLEFISTSSTNGYLNLRRLGGANGTYAYYLNNGVAYLSVDNGSGETRLYSNSGGYYLTFFSNGVEAMRIPTTRNVLIGTTTDAGYKLDVVGTARVSGAITTGVTGTAGTLNLNRSSDGANVGFVRAESTGAGIEIGSGVNMFFSNNGRIVVNSTTTDASAIFKIDSTTQGFLPPRMTATQRGAISTPAVGLVVYQTDGVEGLYVNTSGGWKALTIV